MPSKHDRSISNISNDFALSRRRQLRAERNRRYRARQRATHTAPTSSTYTQLQQGEQIIDLIPLEEEQPPNTISSIGVRVQGITLPQDAQDARLQQETQPTDEHLTLYQKNLQQRVNRAFFRQFASPKTGPPIASSSSNAQPLATLSQYFRSLPPNNPITPGRASIQASTQPSNDPHKDDAIIVPSHNDGNPAAGTDIANNAIEHQATNFDISVQGSEDQLRESSTEGSERENDSASEDSFQDFVSERSSQSDDDTNEPVDMSADDYTIDKLYEELQHGFHGCTEDEHNEKLREHMEAAGGRHHELNEVFNDVNFPSVLGLVDMITPERLARQQDPTPEQWEAMFCGVSRANGHEYPMNVCLHKERTQAVEPDVAFDVDSFLGFATSLAMARKGLWYQPAPQMRQNMRSDVHLETNIFRSSRDPEQAEQASTAMLRDVPHFLLGRIVGAHDITLHVLFPHIEPTQDKFVSLSREQLTRWTDKVLNPALYKYYPAHYTQHLPASYRHAWANSKSHQVEGRKIETASYQSQMSLGHHLQPQRLGAVWNDIIETIDNTPGLADFREPQLFFQAIGTKLQFKTDASCPTLLDAMEAFESYFEDLIDPQFVQLDRFYTDIGKEICARTSLLREQHAHVEEEAQVYSWKRCCLEKYIMWMYDGQPPAAGNRGQRYYDQNMLYEASSLTTLTPKRSKLREGGLIYTQFYGSVKEISDAAKCKPFNNDGLEEMALDPQISQGLQNATGGRRREARIIERAYLASKCRIRDAIQDSVKKSFGIREEHRISWMLFQGLLRRLRSCPRQELEIVLTDCPSYAWAVRTEVYLNYLWRSADKFATGFEVIRARSRRDLVRWEETKMMAMFLRCLRFVFGGYELRRESALWWGRRERTFGEPEQTRVWYGLGFSNTLARYGYCWLEPRMDWGRLQFRLEISDQVLFGNRTLQGQYMRRGQHVQGFLDLTQRLELALIWIQRYQGIDRVRQRLMEWMAEMCLQQFRIDIMTGIRGEIRAEHREEAVKGETRFCREYLEEIMVGGVHAVSGNKTNFKLAEQLTHFLFDFDDARRRTHWENRPYRKLYRRAVTGMAQALGGRRYGRWLAGEVHRRLLEGHWMLPYPCAEVLLQTTKGGARMWYSVVHQPRREGQGREVTEWKWGGKGWQEGRPEARAGWVNWSKEEWEAWMSRQGGG